MCGAEKKNDAEKKAGTRLFSFSPEESDGGKTICSDKGEFMQSILLEIFLLAVGFILLVKGADYFIDGASSMALRFHIPMIVVGLSAAAFGTSLPEAAISISAAFKGNPEISVGNVMGSNILNILLILGITACITPLAVRRNTVRTEIPLVIGVTVFVTCAGTFLGELNFFVGAILWAILIAFFIYLLILVKRGRADSGMTQAHTILSPGRSLFCIAIGIVAVVLGSDVAVDSASSIAKYVGVSDRIIGLTVIALGASLPELAISAKAALKGNADIAVGNIVGSNLFNLLFVLGTTTLLTPVAFSRSFIADGIICTAAALLLWLFCSKNGKLSLRHGFLMILLYAAYIAYLVMGQAGYSLI